LAGPAQADDAPDALLMGNVHPVSPQESVTVPMSAPPAAVWALISDVTRIGEFSPETFEAQWLRGATGPAEGAYFRGHVKRNGVGPVYWTTCKVVACEPEREFAFSVMAGARVVDTWRYVIAPAGDGVEVTESFELGPNPLMKLYWVLLGRLRGRTNREGMRQTLERIRDVVEGVR
jgi:hypothetical protein